MVDGCEWAEWLEFPEVNELLDRESELFMLLMLPQTLDLRDPVESVGDAGGVFVQKIKKKIPNSKYATMLKMCTLT